MRTTSRPRRGDTFKIALYHRHLNDRSDDDYAPITTTDEVSGTGYTAGGTALTNVTPTTSRHHGLYRI